MSASTESGLSRREMIQTTGKVAVASALAGVALPHVHAAENNTINIALVGCGNRGAGAAGDALSSTMGPTKLVAMADVFPNKPGEALKSLQKDLAKQLDVPKDRQFVDFQAYKHAMDCLRPGDVVILATPPAFRWVHFTYALQKGLNVFMEKPVTVDGPSTRRMLKLADESEKRPNIKVGVGLMCRHCVVRKELFDRIKSGQIGDIQLLRAYRVRGQEAKEFSEKMKPDYRYGELLYQIERFHSFLWASGGCFSDFLIHNIDECCWMKDAWPVSAKAIGGRQYRDKYIDQNFDHYSVEYTFPDGAKLMLEGRNIPGCWGEFASYAHGSKGSAVISSFGHTPAKCRIYKGQNLHAGNDLGKGKDEKNDLAWHGPKDEPNPYRVEWNDLMYAIRNDKPYNEVRRGAEASLVTAMGRMAAHTGQIITRDQMLNCEHELAPDVDKFEMNSPAPVRAGADGKYPVPRPGRNKKREY